MNARAVVNTISFALAPLLACACSESDRPVFFSAADWAAAIDCIQLPDFENQADVTDVVGVSDSVFAVLFADDRSIVTYDDKLRATDTLRFDKDGPRGVRGPVSIAIDDSLIYVADDAAARVKRFDHDGRERGHLQLAFLPRRVRTTSGGILITPLVAGATPPALLYHAEGGVVTAANAPIARYRDISTNTLANMTSLVTTRGSAVVMHEMVVPFGYVVPLETGAGSSARRFAVPIPDAARNNIGQLPEPPITERNVNELTVVAFTAAADVAAGSIFYVTRLGDGKRSKYQKVLVELDTTMTPRRIAPIDVNQHHLIYLPARRALIGADAQINCFECKV